MRLLVGQSFQFTEAADWSFVVSDARVIKEDGCAGGTTGFQALKPGSSLVDALLPTCRGCGMPSYDIRVTVIVDRNAPLLPALVQDRSVPDTVALLAEGEKVEVAMPRDYDYQLWQHVNISNPKVLLRLDTPTTAIGLLTVEAAAPGVADLTADAKAATRAAGAGGFFRMEFVVRPPSQLADVAAGYQDSGKAVSVHIGQILAFSLPNGLPATAVIPGSHAGLFQAGPGNRPLLVSMLRPSIDGMDHTPYLLAQAVGSENVWWSSCPATVPLGPSCQPEVTLNVVPSGTLAVEASDSDRETRFTLHPGQEILITLHPYIAPWEDVTGAGSVVGLVSRQTANGLQLWTFRALAPGSVVLDASYQCPRDADCPIDPRITVDVT